MSQMIAVRLQEGLLEQVDAERRQAGLSRAATIAEALRLWIDRRRYEEAVRRDQEGYARRPVKADEFEPLLGAQAWPR
jgi:metal-responsive CopG/Arc/MetJ family transcriptional regulator